MKILILSATTGGGHMRAANSIKTYILENDSKADVEVIDTLEYINPILNTTITNGYVYLATKTPKIYGKIYELTNKEQHWTNFVTRTNNMFANKLIPLIEEYKADLILTTHPFPTTMVSLLKGNGRIKCPLLCIMTDYAPHKTWVNENVDAYIVSNDDMIAAMMELGVESNKICPYGIPIEEVFFEEKDRDEVLNELSLAKDSPVILMMAGSFGVTNVFKIYEKIISLENELQIIVITGKNKKLYDDFDETIKSSTKLTKLIYFTSEVSKYMQASDIIITKPGGLTITEALACNIPMAIFDAIPGQEEENAEFLITHNMAIKIDTSENCDEIIIDLLNDKKRLEKMKKACKTFHKNNSSKNIWILIKKMINESKDISKLS